MFFDRVNYDFRQICQKYLIYTIKIHWTHEICQRKFGRVKGALELERIRFSEVKILIPLIVLI